MERKREQAYVAAFRAKEMPNMILPTRRHNHLAFNRCLAASAPRAKELVEVEVAIESQSFV